MTARNWKVHEAFDLVEGAKEQEACRAAFIEWHDDPDANYTLAWLGWQSAWRAAAKFHTQKGQS